jgi:Zn-dependent protease with chaperone function
LLLLTVVLVFVCNPIVNATSRYFEHQADQYALEITHDLTPDSGQVGAQAFQSLGYVGLSDPDPNPSTFSCFMTIRQSAIAYSFVLPTIRGLKENRPSS